MADRPKRRRTSKLAHRAEKREPDWDAHCADFAMAHVKAITGRDIWKEVGGSPRSARETSALYRRLKTRTLKGAATKLFGEPIAAAFAMRCDLALVMSGEIAALGIVRGDQIECADRMLPIDRAECVWPISPFRG